MPRAATYEYFQCGISIDPAEVTLPTGEKQRGWILTIHDENPYAPATHILPLDQTSRDNIIKGLTSGIVPASASDLSALKGS